MKRPSTDKVFTVKEYIRHEWTAEKPSDFIDGLLYEIPGAKEINNEVSDNMICIFIKSLKNSIYQVYANDIKVKIYGESKYYYPEVFITKENENEKTTTTSKASLC